MYKNYTRCRTRISVLLLSIIVPGTGVFNPPSLVRIYRFLTVVKKIKMEIVFKKTACTVDAAEFTGKYYYHFPNG